MSSEPQSPQREETPMPQREPAPRRTSRMRSNRSTSAASSESSLETGTEAERQPPARGTRRRRSRTRGTSSRAGLSGIDEVGGTGRELARNASGSAVQPRGGDSREPQKNDDDNDMGDKPLKLRLDLNLDVAVELKARVHGDLTLSLLR